MDTTPCDSNFCFPIPPSFESDRVKLTPLVPSEHAKPIFEQMQLYPQIFNLLPMEPFKDFDAFSVNFLANNIHKDTGSILFVIYDKTKASALSDAHPDIAADQGALAGIIGLTHSSPADLNTEIGCVVIFPPFQRTHVTTHSAGLLLQYALNLPSEQPGALGLRRVSWRANWLNKASVRTAERLGFKFETVLRWNRVFPVGKVHVGAGNGRKTRPGDPRADHPGVDSVVLGLCWDDWEDEAKEKVAAAMSRTV
ncbi:hypothetical protein CVT25_011688 [Psilocybe cyanescens]|uniref:N-acetyltransferase domain-containing protein n=1 Tax=Psilocybe cyanescens TaxID=93625 RepID=A0A409WII0_PSICY|nr:hypothetical protein CVT25_011688 [Psilocybe cyanescens]